jgi:hypothetical protein
MARMFKFSEGDRVDCLDYHGPLGAAGTILKRWEEKGFLVYRVAWDGGNPDGHVEIQSTLVPLESPQE